MVDNTSRTHALRHLELLGSFTRFRTSDIFSTRDQSQIFFCSRSDELNNFNKLQTEFWYWWKIFSEPSVSPRNFIIPKLGFSSNFGFFRRAYFPSCLISYLLPTYYVSNIIFYWYEVLQKTSWWRNVVLPKTWCFQNVILINLSHCLTMVEQLIRLIVHSWTILWPSCTSKLLDRSLSLAIRPPSWCSTNLLFSLNHVKFYVIKTQHSSRYLDSQKLGSKFQLCRSWPFYPFGRVTAPFIRFPINKVADSHVRVKNWGWKASRPSGVVEIQGFSHTLTSYPECIFCPISNSSSFRAAEILFHI